jgi:O-antigen ligase
LTDRIVIESQRLQYALQNRRVQLFGAGLGVALLLIWISTAIVAGELKTVALGVALVAAPFLLVLAYVRPYVFPYGLYVVLQPFENLLGGGPSGSVIKLLGVGGTVAILFVIFRQRRIVRPHVTLTIAGLYVLWVLLSSIWAVDMNIALSDAQTIFSLVAMFAVLSVAPISERDLRAIRLAIIASGVAASLYGIWYFLQFPPSEDGRLAIDFAGRHIDSNTFADALLAPIALALVGLLHSRSAHALLASLAALAVLAEGVIISLSREAMFGCLAVIVVTILMSRRKLVGMAVLVPAVACVPLLVPAIAGRFMSAAATGGAGRTSIWQVDIHAWLSHPIIGWGAGSAFQAYNANLLKVAPALFAGWSRPPHNTPLHTLVDLGLVGLLLLGACYFFTFRQMRGIGRDDPLYDLRVGLTASLVAIGLVSFFIDNAVDKYVWIVICAAAQLRTAALLRARAAPAAVVYEPPPPIARLAR